MKAEPTAAGTSARSAILIFTSLFILYFWRIIFLQQYLCWGDVMLQFWPWRHFSREMMLGGKWPLWNPYIFCGLPFAANPQTSLFYPVNLALMALPAYQSVTWGAILHVWACGTLMILYLRTLGCSTVAQLIGACAFALSGCVIARLQFVNHMVSFAALPALLFLYECLRVKFRPRLFVGIVAVCAMIILGGHAHINVIVMSGIGLYVLSDCLSALRSMNVVTAIRPVITTFSAAIVGFALAAIQWLPSAELVLNSSRTAFDSEKARIFALPPWQLGVWLVPDLFGNPARSFYWGEGNFFEVSPYIGVAPLVLAIAGAGLLKDRIRPPLLIVCTVGLLFGMGYYAPFYPWMARWLPPLKMFRAAGRWLFLSVFALSTLAALGWDALVHRPVMMNRVFRVASAWVVVLAACCLVLLVFGNTVARLLEPAIAFVLARTPYVEVESLPRFSQAVTLRASVSILPTLIVMTMFVAALHALSRHSHVWSWGGWMVLGLAFGDLFWFGSSFNPTAGAEVFHVRPEVQPAADFRIATPQPYITALWGDYVNYGRFIMPKPGPQPFSKPIELYVPATNMVTRAYNAEGYEGVRLGGYDQRLLDIERQNSMTGWRELAVRWVLSRTLQGQSVFNEVPDPLPRAYMIDPIRPAGTSATIPVLLVDDVNRVRALCDGRSGTFVLKDVWYPGWKSYVNGTRVKLYAGDGFRRTSFAGRSRVVLVFQNEALVVGACVSMLTASVLSGAAAARCMLSANAGVESTK